MRGSELWDEVDKMSIAIVITILIVAGVINFTIAPLFSEEDIEEFVRSLSTDVISTCLIFALPYLIFDGMNKRRAKKREDALLVEIEKRVSAIVEENHKRLLAEVETRFVTSIEEYKGLSADSVPIIQKDGDRKKV